MKFIPLLVIVILCVTGAEQISADYSCFGDSCHGTVMSGKGDYSDHSDAKFTSCMVCHETDCGKMVNYLSMKIANDKINADKKKTIAEMEAAESNSGSAAGSSSSSSGREVQLFTDGDTDTVWKIIADSGVGLVFAAISIFYNISLIIVPILMCAVIAICVMLNKTEAHRDLLKGIGIIIVVVILLKLYISFVSHATPDLSTISF